MKFSDVAVYTIRLQKWCSLITIYCNVSILSDQRSVSVYRRLRRWFGSAKVCRTKFNATALTVLFRSTFSQVATQCSTQSFHEVAYLFITTR